MHAQLVIGGFGGAIVAALLSMCSGCGRAAAEPPIVQRTAVVFGEDEVPRVELRVATAERASPRVTRWAVPVITPGR